MHASLPETNGRNVAAGETDTNKDDIPIRGTRTLTEKGKTFKLTTLKERKEKINGRLLRKCGTIEDMFFSARNLVAMEEELTEFKDMFRTFLGLHERPPNFIKKRLQHRCFPVKFGKLLRAPILKNICLMLIAGLNPG